MISASGVVIGRHPCTNVPTSHDIALQQARITRFGGAIWAPLLLHSWLVAAMAYEETYCPHYAVCGLLHDAAEVVTGEVVAPFKCDDMRLEQDWVDTKLAVEYNLATWRCQTDYYSTIKLMDWRACDLEAVAGGLPGYSEKAVEYSVQRRGYQIERPYDNPFWMAFQKRLMAGDLYHWARRMEAVLEAARLEEWSGVKEMFDVLMREVANASEAKEESQR